MDVSVVLLIHHGGHFKKITNLQYCDGSVTEFDIDPDLLSVGDLREKIESYGYEDEMIKVIYF